MERRGPFSPSPSLRTWTSSGAPGGGQSSMPARSSARRKPERPMPMSTKAASRSGITRSSRPRNTLSTREGLSRRTICSSTRRPSATSAIRKRLGQDVADQAVDAAHGRAAFSRAHRLEQRQADDVAVGAGEEGDEARGAALDGIAAGLAAPFAAREVGVDLGRAQPLEAHDGLDQARAHRAVGAADRDAAQHAVAPARQQRQAARAPRPRSRPWAGCAGRRPRRVSAASTTAPGWRQATAASLALAMRSA